MPLFADALTEDRNGTAMAIEVTAGAKINQFPSGYNEWRKTIGCRVSAPALEGRANKAIITLVAETLSLPTSAVSIKSGATSSIKHIHISGLTAAEILAKLEST